MKLRYRVRPVVPGFIIVLGLANVQPAAQFAARHHHSGLSYLTPADVHYGRATATLARRHRARLAAYAAHPERFVQGPPRLERLPHAVWINPPASSTAQEAPGATIVTPADPQHRGITGALVTLEHQSTGPTQTVESLQ